MKYRKEHSGVKEIGLLLLVMLAAVVPLLGLGYFLLKAADDELIAERVRAEERERERELLGLKSEELNRELEGMVVRDLLSAEGS